MGKSNSYSSYSDDEEQQSSSSNIFQQIQQQPQQRKINNFIKKSPKPENFQELYCNTNVWSTETNSLRVDSIVSTKKVTDKQTSLIEQKKDVILKLSLKEWLAYLKESASKQSTINYSIERSSYYGLVEDYNVSFKCVFEVFVFFLPNENQIQIPLLPSTVCIKSSSIHYSKDFNGANDFNVSKQDEDSCIGIYSDAHSLFSDKIGRYTVELNILANFLTPKKNGVGIATPKSTFNHIEIRVPRKVNIDIVEPEIRDHAFDNTTQYKEFDGEEHTIKTCPFSPTSYLKIQWTDIEQPSIIAQQQDKINQIDLGASSGGGSSKQAQIKPVVESTKLNVEQNTLCSVGEGVVVITSRIRYEVVSGSASSFDILVGPEIKVLGVEGSNIKRWECQSANLVEVSPMQNKDQLIKVQLTSSVETAYTLLINAEITMESTSATVRMPSIKSIGNEISREKGYLVVESTANVEVEALTREGLTLIDKTELPSDLEAMTSGPILLSYKFLVPKYSATFKVVKHADLSVLVAICQLATFTCTVSSEGATLYKLVFTIRNTQQQYIRITIPHEYEIWSTIVGGKAVKPAVDDSGCLMIPLNKSGSEQGIQKKFQVELVYKHAKDMVFNESGGKLGLVFPQIDIPISMLQVSCYLPTSYNYSLFTGNIKQVNRFAHVTSKNSYKECETNDDDDENQAWGGQMMSQQAPMQMMSNANPMSNMAIPLAAAPPPGGSDGTAGLKPVIVNIPTVGKCYRLEQLLVISTEINISTNYKSPQGCQIL